MRVCLMIEGQEGVTWEQWLALAKACERVGFEALFQSDHYVSFQYCRSFRYYRWSHQESTCRDATVRSALPRESLPMPDDP